MKQVNKELIDRVAPGGSEDTKDELSMEIQYSLLEQSRKLSIKLQEEHDLKIELETMLESSVCEAASLLAKNQILTGKNSKSI